MTYTSCKLWNVKFYYASTIENDYVEKSEISNNKRFILHKWLKWLSVHKEFECLFMKIMFIVEFQYCLYK